MSLRIRSEITRRGWWRLLFLTGLTIFALSLLRPASVVAEESQSQDDEWCFDFSDSRILLERALKYPILLDEISDLKKGNINLKEQLKIKDELLVIAEQRRELQVERADFYQKMSEAQEKLTEGYAKMNESLQKQVSRNKTWDTLKIVGSFILGILATMGLGL